MDIMKPRKAINPAPSTPTGVSAARGEYLAAVNAGLALVCGPALADALVTRRLLASGQATW
jgi:hypothetical protein